MKILCPNFIDLHMDFRKKSFINSSELTVTRGGVSPLLTQFKGIEWIKPSALINNYQDDIKAYFIDVGDGIKRSFIDFSVSDIVININFVHVMYGDYFNIISKNNSVLSVDFAGLCSGDHAKKILGIDDVRYVFCSDHDSWADFETLVKMSQNRIIFWHSPNEVVVFHNYEFRKVSNSNVVDGVKVVVGAGDLLAVEILRRISFSDIFMSDLDCAVDAARQAMAAVSGRFL